MITIACCYNDEDCLKKMLLPSIERQNTKVDIILINNNEKKYSSAAMAYNNEVVRAKGDIIVFCHQDIAFDENFAENIEEIFKEHPNIILGVAGIKKDGFVYSQLKYYKTKEYITQKRLNNELEEVESIDECLFAIKKEHFLKMMFDQVVCNHWHLYGVELCYHGKKSDMKLVPMVTSTQVYHKMESGTGLEVDKNFLKIIGKLCRKYKDENKIYAPCYIISTKFPKRQLKILRTRMKLILKK